MGNPRNQTGNARQVFQAKSLLQEVVFSIRWKGKHALEVTFLEFHNLICDGQARDRECRTGPFRPNLAAGSVLLFRWMQKHGLVGKQAHTFGNVVSC